MVADFVPERGLRQGDPLSPYLFILVADVLSKLVKRACALNQLKGIKMARGFPELSHCFFADDALFFMRVTVENCAEMRRLLDVYCKASGQEVNLDKPGLFFSANTSLNVKEDICQCLCICDQNDPGLYLGLPAVWERAKASALRFVVEKVRRKMGGWKQKISITRLGVKF